MIRVVYTKTFRKALARLALKQRRAAVDAIEQLDRTLATRSGPLASTMTM
ncbi:MAG: hypothetical protein LBD97_04740 [Bifidobacteriaceae bacterium]|jgi:mRNA-degrading endonuclease RelE of RelBE toxin-antitoxin system|nr:hypothetical protein [Bifidobacteriaceae bacterium]